MPMPPDGRGKIRSSKFKMMITNGYRTVLRLSGFSSTTLGLSSLLPIHHLFFNSWLGDLLRDGLFFMLKISPIFATFQRKKKERILSCLLALIEPRAPTGSQQNFFNLIGTSLEMILWALSKISLRIIIWTLESIELTLFSSPRRTVQKQSLTSDLLACAMFFTSLLPKSLQTG